MDCEPRTGLEDPCFVPGSLLPVLEEVKTRVGARGGYGEDDYTVVRSSLVGDSVEVEEVLDDSAVSGKRVPTGGVAMRLPSIDERQQQPLCRRLLFRWWVWL
ncbi:hypothetical protein Dimus_018301 [Dionaea muscipula]